VDEWKTFLTFRIEADAGGGANEAGDAGGMAVQVVLNAFRRA
jgi:hypothetical protein